MKKALAILLLAAAQAMAAAPAPAPAPAQHNSQENLHNVEALKQLLLGSTTAKGQSIQLNGHNSAGAVCTIKVSTSVYGIGFLVTGSATPELPANFWVSRSAGTSENYEMTVRPGEVHASQVSAWEDEREDTRSLDTLDLQYTRASRNAVADIKSLTITNNVATDFEDTGKPVFNSANQTSENCTVD